MQTKDELIQLRITKELKDKLRGLAEKNGLSMSSYICYLISKEK